VIKRKYFSIQLLNPNYNVFVYMIIEIERRGFDLHIYFHSLSVFVKFKGYKKISLFHPMKYLLYEQKSKEVKK